MVLVAGWVVLVAVLGEDAGVDEASQPGGEQAGGDAEIGVELVEAVVAVENVVDDEHRPPLADQPERG